MKDLRNILSLALVIASIFLCRQVISDSISNQRNKKDYAELNHVRHGLFSVGQWKRQVIVILADEINKLDLSKTNEKELRRHLETLLDSLIDKIDKKVREGNTGSAEGWVKQSFINMFINLEDIKKGIPGYADAIINEMTKSETRGQLRAMLSEQLEQYFKQTFDTPDTSQMRRILFRTNSKDIESARIRLAREISVKQDLISKEAILLIILSVILFVLSGAGRQPLAPSRHVILVLSLLVLLVAGVTTPMIDMEAKISRMSLVLIGHPIHFENQVLYFQSKSILDVFLIMITHHDIQMKLVGLLLVTFSTVFPVLKMISSLAYCYDYRRAKENPVVKFFVLKSGKWSMADVMVVAIFMAYIGFNGIITSQFGQLDSNSPDLLILTTNGTSLQPGYYLFLTYTLLALFLTGLLQRQPRPPEIDGP